MLIPAPESSIFNLTDDGERGWYFFPSLSPHFSDGWDLHLSESSSTFLCSVSVKIWKKNLRGRLTLYPRWRRKRIRLNDPAVFRHVERQADPCCPCCIHLDDRNRMVRWRVKLRSKEQLYDRPKAISTEPGPTSTALNNSWTMCVAYELHRKWVVWGGAYCTSIHNIWWGHWDCVNERVDHKRRDNCAPCLDAYHRKLCTWTSVLLHKRKLHVFCVISFLVLARICYLFK